MADLASISMNARFCIFFTLKSHFIHDFCNKTHFSAISKYDVVKDINA